MLLERAEPTAIVVSGPVRDLVAGAGFVFTARDPILGGAGVQLWAVH
ncbi:MAG: hypothetical protein JNK78_14910 [Planctomycetes bacterium]|nr:hypothetical protein [Planctomycetota bacterium]